LWLLDTMRLQQRLRDEMWMRRRLRGPRAEVRRCGAEVRLRSTRAEVWLRSTSTEVRRCGTDVRLRSTRREVWLRQWLCVEVRLQQRLQERLPSSLPAGPAVRLQQVLPQQVRQRLHGSRQVWL
jgi:hypothetical protein